MGGSHDNKLNVLTLMRGRHDNKLNVLIFMDVSYDNKLNVLIIMGGSHDNKLNVECMSNDPSKHTIEKFKIIILQDISLSKSSKFSLPRLIAFRQDPSLHID